MKVLFKKTAAGNTGNIHKNRKTHYTSEYIVLPLKFINATKNKHKRRRLRYLLPV